MPMSDRPPERRRALPSLPEMPAYLLAMLSPRQRRTFWVLACTCLTLVIALAVVLAPEVGDRKREASARDEAVELRAQERRRARQVVEQRPRRRSLRAGSPIPSAVEAAVLADGRARADRGELDDMPLEAACRRDGRGPEPGSTSFTCLAVTSRIEGSEKGGDVDGALGYPYRAVTDRRRGRVTLCKVTGRAGEGGLTAQPTVPLARACGG